MLRHKIGYSVFIVTDCLFIGYSTIICQPERIFRDERDVEKIICGM
jgi:hypothetical protein